MAELTDGTDKAASAPRTAPAQFLELAQRIGRTGVRPDDATTARWKEQLNTALASVAVERQRDGLEACLLEPRVDTALQWLFDIGFIAAFLPELRATVDLRQEAGRRHKDVWEHTKLVVKQAVKRPGVRWAALLHDIGKVPTRTFTDSGVHFHGHAEVGARMFDKIARRIPFDRDRRRQIRFLIKYHLRSAQYDPSWTDAAVRRFARDMAPHLRDLLDLSRADITSRRPGRRQALLRQISELSRRIDEIRELDAKQPPLPTGVGTAIMEAFELPPSKLIGNVKEALEAAIDAGELEERREDDYYVAWLRDTGTVERLRSEWEQVQRERRGRKRKPPATSE